MIITLLVLSVVIGSLYGLYRAVMAREDEYYGEYFDPNIDEDDYLTEEEWEQIDPTLK